MTDQEIIARIEAALATGADQTIAQDDTMTMRTEGTNVVIEDRDSGEYEFVEREDWADTYREVVA